MVSSLDSRTSKQQKTTASLGQKSILYYNLSKIKFPRNLRSIVQSRKDYPATLTGTIPKKIVLSMGVHSGDILQLVAVQEGTDAYIKVMRALV